MSIPLKRFQSLDADFHVGVADFKSIVDDAQGTLNKADAFIAEKTSDMEAAVGQLKQELKEANGMKDAMMGAANDAIKDVTRFTKDLGQEITDMSMIPEKYINGVLDDIFGTSDGLGMKMKGLVKTCRNQALSKAGLGSNKFGTPKCNGLSMSAGQCSSSGASGLLSSATTGIFSKGFGAVNNLIKKVMSLAGLGFNANLCNVTGPLFDTAFGAAGSLFDSVASATGVKTLVASSLGNMQALLGNVGAVSDLARNVAGLGIGSFLPSAANNILNMASSTSSTLTGLKGFGDSFMGGFNQDLLAEGRSVMASAEMFNPTIYRSEDDYASVAAFSGTSFRIDSSKAGDYGLPPSSSRQTIPDFDTPAMVAASVDCRSSIHSEDSIGEVREAPDVYAGWFA